jgi:hypothetical protein
MCAKAQNMLMLDKPDYTVLMAFFRCCVPSGALMFACSTFMGWEQKYDKLCTVVRQKARWWWFWKKSFDLHHHMHRHTPTSRNQSAVENRMSPTNQSYGSAKILVCILLASAIHTTWENPNLLSILLSRNEEKPKQLAR